MTREELKESIAAYCLGALDPDEREQVEEYLKQGDADAQALLREMQGVVSGIALSAPEKTPPPSLKQNILKAATPPKVAERPAAVAAIQSFDLIRAARQRWMRLSFGLAFALIAVAIGLGFYTRHLSRQVETLENRVAISSQLVRRLQNDLKKKEKFIDFVQSPGIQLVHLNGLDVAPEADATVFWHPEQRKAVLQTSSLPIPPSDKDYQLWMLQGNQPIDAGVFTPDAGGEVSYELDTLTDSSALTAFAVTLEPKGGVPQPTGAMYLLGTVTGG